MSPFEFIMAVVVILVVLIMAVQQFLHTRNLTGVIQVLTAVDHNKPALDQMEYIGSLVHPDVVQPILALLTTLANRSPSAEVRQLAGLISDITNKVTDGKPNEVSSPGGSTVSS